MNDLTNKNDKIQELLATGNIDQFTVKERLEYIKTLCEATGLNPIARPFDFLRFQGKTVLYASKGCADQLRKINGISIKITERKIEDGVLFVTVEGYDKNGRIDTDLGALPIGNLKGDALANATMKCITKAKRRLTLSMCGLGIMDESEFDTFQGEVQDAKVELERFDNAIERIERKNEITNNLETITDKINSIKSSMASITDGKSVNDKAQAMKFLCGVNKFQDLHLKTDAELQAVINKINEFIKEKEQRDIIKEINKTLE
jgi:hypothetical protein